MSKHTPGPWVWVEPKKVLNSAHGKIINYAPYEGMWFASYIKSVDEANARLIAKAPELLDMLIQCRKEFAGLPHSLGYDFTHLPKLDALIAEATGDA